MKSVYLVEWGYHSCDNSDAQLKAVCTDMEKAYVMLQSDISAIHHKYVKQSVKNPNLWSDGDYYITIREVKLNEEIS